MQHRHASSMFAEVYPPDPWRLIELGFQPGRIALSETLFALANGYLGIRGSLEEGDPRHEPGAFVNGFYETWPINYPEEAFGLPALGQSIVTLPDSTAMALKVDGEAMNVTRGRLSDYQRELDMQSGLLRREFRWESPGGVRLQVCFERLVSFVHRHVAAFRAEITVLAGQGPVTLVSGLVHSEAPARAPRTREATDPRRARGLDEVLVADAAEAVDQRLLLTFHTRRSGLRLACGIDHRVESGDPVKLKSRTEDGGMEYSFEARPGSWVRLEKFVAYYSSAGASSSDLAAHVSADLDRAVAEGFDGVQKAQREYLDRFWQRADVTIDGDVAVQQAVRWNLFHLAQATLRADDLGVPAKGLTGRGYDGHYFWDVEIYVLPFLTYTQPEVARRLLRFRHGMLDAARRQARVVGETGALFPWRTINGDEASGNYPTSTAQYHIDADVAYALRRYVEVTGDRGALHEFGAEILAETARLWASLGFFSPTDGAFHIHSVTGPDEYTAVVDDNVFTNLMAKENLLFAADVIRELRDQEPASFSELAARLDLLESEPDEWRRAAELMFIPYDEKRGIHPQDVSFLEQEPWDFASTPPEHYPLLLHYHPLVLHRHQVVKQADVVLATFLLGDRFSPAQRHANFAYYEPITTADSSLSHAVQTVMAAEVGRDALAYEHFKHALFMDLTNWAGNAEDGVHVASAGGVWLALVYGFAGLRDYGGRITFDPHLPEHWAGFSFNLTAQGQVFEVKVAREAITLRLREGELLQVAVRGKQIEIRPGESVTVELTG